MRILHVASEVAPFSQSGGLAQVAGSLPAAIRDQGSEVATLSPLYRTVRERHTIAPTAHNMSIELDGRELAISISASEDGHHFFVDCPVLFDRDGLYTDDAGTEWADNAVRFAALARVAAQFCQVVFTRPAQILHAHDWQTGLAPVYANQLPTPPKSVFTIHNLAFRGIFDKHLVPALGLSWDQFTLDGFEFWDQLSFLKAGAAFSDAITTVSPRYAEEIRTPSSGEGLDGFFRLAGKKLRGVLNGIDTDLWNPATDPRIAANYCFSSDSSNKSWATGAESEPLTGKTVCREALLKRFGLAVEPKRLLLGVVSRLSLQKSPDLIAELVPQLETIGAALVVLGSGEKRFEQELSALAVSYPNCFSIHVGYDEALAHQVFAGADALLMPSRFEPCGLAQLSAMRYGTIPIASAVGGLKDTIDDGKTGFLLDDVSAVSLVKATGQAARIYASDRVRWRQMIADAIRRDWSWKSAAAQYSDIYRSLLAAA